MSENLKILKRAFKDYHYKGTANYIAKDIAKYLKKNGYEITKKTEVIKDHFTKKELAILQKAMRVK